MLTGANAGEAEVPKEGVNLGLSGALTGDQYNLSFLIALDKVSLLKFFTCCFMDESREGFAMYVGIVQVCL